jgi:DNA-binding GntR family transcriptional regulator
MATQRTKHGGLVQTIVRSLEQEILTGVLKPGERLDEQTLAVQFGASRTPVREALRHLSAAGPVELRPRRGAVVADISIPAMIQMFEVMSVLEGLCARLAARRMTEGERTRLREAHEEYGRAAGAETPDVAECYALSAKFHDHIYAGAHNPFLYETTRNIRTRLSAYRRHQLQQRGRLFESHEEHEAIIAAILAGDGDRTDELMRQHVSVQGNVFIDLVSSLLTEEVMADTRP